MTTEIKFKRARNKGNKEIRFRQIKEAAVGLFDSMPYHEISLSKLGEEINFTRANLYKYVTSKEDIFLDVLLDEIRYTVDDLSKALLGKEILDTRDFVSKWTKILMNHPRFLKLLSLLYMIIEQNSELDALVNFKNNLTPISAAVMKIIKHNFPILSDEEVIKVLDYALSLVISRYPICYPAEIQRRAVEMSSYNYKFPDFEESYSEGLIFIINGLISAKARG